MDNKEISISNTNPFILTMDKKVADILANMNFELISSNNEQYVFLNNKPLTFSSESGEQEIKEITNNIKFTNKLFL